LDFPATFLEAAGVAVPEDMQGRSLLPLLRGQTPDDWRTSFYYHYYEYPGAHSVRKHYGVVTDRYKLFYFYEPEMDYWTLIDRQTDPHELTNVYGNPKYATVQQELKAELARLRTELQVPEEDPPESLAPAARKQAAKKKPAG
jgi:arylsulfatase A-like enzyme